MRFVKIPLLCLLSIMILSSGAWAQYIGCEDLLKSSTDSLRLPYLIKQAAGDTLLLPVSLGNDSMVNAFQILIQFDTTWLRPAFRIDSFCTGTDGDGLCTAYTIDSSYVQHIILSDRFLKDSVISFVPPVTDTITKFLANLWQNRTDVVSCSFLPDLADFDTVMPGYDALFGIKFVLSDTMPTGQLTQLNFFESDIYTINDVVFPPETTFYDGCYSSQMNTIWRPVASNPDSSVEYQVYPKTSANFPYYVQEGVPTVGPQITTFTATPNSFQVGGSTSLSWATANADSAFIINNATSTKISNAANDGRVSGSFAISGLAVGTYSFRCQAWGSGQTVTRDIAVEVTTGTVDPDAPVINVSATATSYNQGELITFTVTATNTTGATITLAVVPSTLPANASFATSGQVVGTSPVSGNFAWTPNTNQDGLFNIRFTATDNAGTTTRDVVLQVEALEFDRLFSTSAPDNQPVGGLPGKTEVAFPIDLVTTQTVYGVQFDMRYPHQIVTVDSFATTGRMPDYIVYDNLNVTPGEVRVVTYDLGNAPVMDTVATTAIMHAYCSLSPLAVPWSTHTIYIENGRESVNPDPGVGSLPLVTDSGVIEIDAFGNVNLDDIIDVADAVSTVAYIIGNFDLNVRQFDVADVIDNDTVNVFDLVGIVNLIYDIPLPSTPAPPAPGQDATISLDYADLFSGGEEILTVRSEIAPDVANVAGVQLELNYDPGAVAFGTPRLTADADNYALHSQDNGNGRLKILLYHPVAPFKNNELMHAGSADLVEIPIRAIGDLTSGDKTKIRLSDALMSTSVAGAIKIEGIDPPLPTTFTLSQNYPNPFNPTTTIEFNLGFGGGDQRVTLDVYNVLGQNVITLVDDMLPAGEHQIHWDATDRTGSRVATGIYLYRLRVGEQAQTKKMLFLK